VTAPGATDSDREFTELLCPPQRRPQVAITKVGPASAGAGTTIVYLLFVSNTGEVPFNEADVTVTDDHCSVPVVVARFDAEGNVDTASPGVLDPGAAFGLRGDTWVYRCTSPAPPAGADCSPTAVTNVATVVARSRRPTVEDSDRLTVPVTCPPTPPAPEPLPSPPPPIPSAPGVTPRPPEAGVAGIASVSRMPRCLRRGSRVIVRGSRIASVRVFVRGRRVGGLRLRVLQRRAVIRLTRDFRPGRVRATAVVTFQRGAGTPGVRFTRTVEICAAPPPPPVTG
jgi:hypothetical protein